ncbi:MAG TPA: O-methyltransferase [Chthonomonadales bacterium]|nr:O-methyltransferase [Chthonomonadales bacterium]
MDLMPQQLRAYLSSLAPDRPPELDAMEEHAREVGFPILGPVAGHFCYLIARLMGARRVFELGSGFGYSTAWFAKAVQENGGGEVYHVVWNEDLSSHARARLDALGYSDVVRCVVGEAVDVLLDTPGPFDIVFNDIDKRRYPKSIPAIGRKLRSGGALIVDNALWHGWIFDQSDCSEDTKGVREATRILTTTPEWVTSVVPLQDGLLLAMKR